MSALEQAATLLKLDLGAGKNKRPGFLGVDCRDFEGVDIVKDLRNPWTWDDNSVEEANASHFLEHLTGEERVHFFNELYRVLIPNGKATIITPHWASQRAYGDFTHQWPPVSEMFYYYLDKNWRKDNAPHNDAYTCDFHAQWGYGVNPQIQLRNQEFQMFALNFYKEAATDLICTVTARK